MIDLDKDNLIPFIKCDDIIIDFGCRGCPENVTKRYYLAISNDGV